MASIPNATNGSISWTEIPVLDLDRAQAFYSGVFAWDFIPLPPRTAGAEPTFVMFRKDSTNGGLVKVTPDNHLTPSLHPSNADKKKLSVRVTITVESVDEALSAILENGGEIYSPKVEVPNNMGFVAYFLDSEKNVMGIWSSK
ncbi:hypothetical protein B7494_g5020 [Chlorociboria aeruginascens]|nr:hypothetical protein B7494_g5020 [Chlorociboria aeruginascens]